MKKCYIVLQNGMTFEGTRFGADTDVIGEMAPDTAGSYMGRLTDPVNAGRIVLQTFPMLGNYGAIPAEQASSRCHLSGIVVREWCETPSNFRSQGDISSYLASQQVAGVCGVDTRQIARILRQEGAMNALICSAPPPNAAEQLKAHKPAGALKQVSSGGRTLHPAMGDARRRAALLSYGAPGALTGQLTALGIELHEFPFDAPADELSGFELLVLTDGPGDPADNPDQVNTLKQLLGAQPILAFGLGHQLLALAAGGKTARLPQGHFGANQPVRRVSDGVMFITQQNQLYTVDGTPPGAELTHTNFNDGSVAGLRYQSLCAISLQHMPGGRELPEILERLVKR